VQVEVLPLTTTKVVRERPDFNDSNSHGILYLFLFHAFDQSSTYNVQREDKKTRQTDRHQDRQTETRKKGGKKEQKIFGCVYRILKEAIFQTLSSIFTVK
jgi:hypothetical protein